MPGVEFCSISNDTRHKFCPPASEANKQKKNLFLFQEFNEENKEETLHYAVALNNISFLKILLNSGASVNKINKHGSTLLHTAIIHGNEEIIKTLLAHGPKAIIKDSLGRTALHLILCSSFLDKRKMTRIAKLILDSEFDTKILTNESDCFGKTALHCAIENGYEEMVQLLLQYGANVNNKDRDGKNSLYYAVEFNKVKIAESLLKKGAKVNDKMNHGMVALHEAVKQKSEKCLQLLLSYGAEVNSKDIYGTTPLHLAVQFFYLDEKKMEKILKLLLHKGADINDQTHYGETSFHCAIINGNEKLVRLLLEHGADVNSKNNEGKSPLHFAIQYSNKNIVKLLLNKGAFIDTRTSDGKLALHVAVAVEDENMIKILLENNANVNAVDKSGKTPLCLAFEMSHMRSIYNPWNGFYPNHLDIAGCNNNIFELLIKYIAKLKYVCDENLKMIIHNEKLNSFFLQCQKELKKMKEKNVCDNISMYKVLTKNDDALIGYTRNENLLNIISTNLYENNFPIYYCILKERFCKANNRKKLLELSTSIFGEFTRPFILPEIIKNQILGYLTVEDLRNLNKISKTKG